MEGNHCYNPPSGCDTTGLEMPIWEYNHSIGVSVTGGYVYRGETVPEIVGKYIYGDYVERQIWALSYDGINPPQNELLETAPYNIASFGIDENNELYICTFNGSNSKIYRFKPTAVSNINLSEKSQVTDFSLGENYPDPFNPITQIPFSVSKSSFINISIYDINGRLVRTLIQSQLSAGSHSVIWDGKDERGNTQSSGLFLYQLEIDGQAKQTKRLVLLK
jgi:hypothetical protein